MAIKIEPVSKFLLRSLGSKVFFSWCLAAILTLGSVSTQAQEDAFICGSDEASFALGKSAAIPAIRKKWSGTLKALILRISFTNAPFTIDTTTMITANATINKLYASMSRNTFQWDFRIYPQVLASPGASSDFDTTTFENLQTWIVAQLRALNLKRGTDYDVYIAVFPQISVGWAGLSNLNDANWINRSYSAGVVGHELGHSLGLPHAHSIEAGTDIFGVPGTTSQSVEYGNLFDIMGNGSSSGQFNTAYKWNIGWMDTAEVLEVKAPGTYRIYSHDNEAHKGRLASLRIPSGNASYAYWIEYRSGLTTTRNGACVMFSGFLNKKTDNWLLDATPGSRRSSDESDGVLAVGKSLVDKYGTTSFEVLGVNSNVWDANGYVDVLVTMPGITSIAPKLRRNALRGGGGQVGFVPQGLALNALGRLIPISGFAFGFNPDRTIETFPE